MLKDPDTTPEGASEQGLAVHAGPPSRRALLRAGWAGLAALGLGGCSSDGSALGVSGPTYQALTGMLGGSGGGPDGGRLTREYVDSRPFAFIVAQFRGSPRALIALATIEGEDLLWLSARREMIRTRHGRVVQTAGLAENLRETHELDPDPLASNATRLPASESRRMITIQASDGLGAMIVESRFEVKQPQPVVILDRQHDTVLVTERCVAQGVRSWRFENQHWVDPSNGFVWRTRQYVAPGLPALTIEVATPAPVGQFAPTPGTRPAARPMPPPPTT
ncbi:MAG: YjbF family lipoprotein [Alphaproteobacteria bacterium]|nr:YjbF family lipoprotein [Alphaproteobacteria bacterium]